MPAPRASVAACGRLVRASVRPWCSTSTESSGKSLQFSPLIDRHALGVGDDQAGVGGWPGAETAAGQIVQQVGNFQVPQNRYSASRRGVICPCLCPHPPVLTTLASHRRVIRASVLMSSVPALSSLQSSWWYPHLVAASSGPCRLQGLVTSCVASPRRRARRHIAASTPRHRRVVASSSIYIPLSPPLFQEAV